MNNLKNLCPAWPAMHQQMHLGWWIGEEQSLVSSFAEVKSSLRSLSKPIFAVLKNGELAFATSGSIDFNLQSRPAGSLPLLAVSMPKSLEFLGDPSFCKDHGLKYAYVGGSMAHGISSPEIAVELGKNGMLGFIGSAGDSPKKVEETILRMKSLKEQVPFGFNLIHSPNEKGLEDELVDLFLKHEIRLIEASAFLSMTLPLVRYRITGIYQDENGKIIAPNKIIAKVSRVEVASKFFAPPPEKMLQKLVETNVITQEQAKLAARIPVAQDLTSEADSGGHTDNRPAVSLHPTMVALKNRLQKEYSYDVPLRVGFGGGTGTPASAAAAFAMGAAYIVTGTVNQACIESGTSDAARLMLAQAGQADMIMAPAGDMFEMGVTVQVLKRGTMFAMRAQKLYEIYRKYNSIDEIPAPERQNLEKSIFKDSLDNIWNQTVEFFKQRDPSQIERGERDPHHKMALIFRWYLGKSPRWAVSGDEQRKMDYQIWCGPAMGAFNEWVKGSFLEAVENRKVYDVAMNLLYGAALEMRFSQLRMQGICLAAEISNFSPVAVEEIQSFL
ncbi:MAG: trans-AT polyketide synthase, acyltransferase and oxidoreductase domain [Clostridiales bacterium]|nr:trans-AT polyketide synthase, acyltransferase and oxidoreductase domain [Clostridiales bacterium]MDN5283413.1 trans-AT polyketide synthase, acyltransferase and oxidoreductase domain [Candidatus Ozemobacter sp.]